MKTSLKRLAGAYIALAGVMLTAIAYSYTVVPGHQYRFELDASNFVGSVVSLSYLEITALHQPAFVDSIWESSGEEFVSPGETIAFHLDFSIAPGSWGQSDTLRVRMQFGNTFQVQPDHWDLEFPLEVAIECSVSCEGISEGEPYFAGADFINGGCNSSPPVFHDVQCGDTICGTGFTYYLPPYNYRDTDWYQYSIETSASLTWEVEAEFPVQTFIADGSLGCEAPGYIVATTADSCGIATLSTGCLPPGIYWFFVAPSNFIGVPSEMPYRAILTCDTCEFIDPCQYAEEIHCQQVISDNNSGTDSWVTYPECGGFFETGPERLFHIVIPYDGTQLTAALSDLSADLDVFVLEDCDPRTCLAGANDTLSIVLDQGDYYLAVDGYQDAVSNFTLSLICGIPQPPPPEIAIQRLDSASVELTWEYSVPVDSFYVYRDTGPVFLPSPTSFMGATDSASFTDTDALLVSSNYFYKVTAIRAPARRDSRIGTHELAKPAQVYYGMQENR
jgi:hypothetical protein